MDKNTIIGMLLIIGVLFCFNWFGPKRAPVADTTETEDVSPQTAVSTTPDYLSATEKEWLVKNIMENGEPVVLADSTHATRLRDGAIALTAAGDSVFGTVVVDGKTLNWSDITNADLKKMSIQEQRKAVEAVRNASVAMGRYGKFARFLSGSDSIIHLENDVIKLQLSAKSGSITRAELKKYDTEYTPDESAKRKEKVVVFENGSNTFDFQLPLPNPVNSADLYFTPQVLNDSTVRMSLPLGDNAFWALDYTLPRGDSYVIGIKVVQKNLDGIIESNNRNLGINWHQDLIRQEKGKMFEERNSGLYYKYAGGSVEHLSESKNDTEDRKAKIRWIGFKNQFFSSVLVADRPFNTADFQSKVLKNDPWLLKRFDTQAVVNDYDWKAETPAQFSLFIGPNLYPLLSSLDKKTVSDENLNLTKLIPLGWSIFRWINTGVVIPIFTFLGSFISNYGIIILIMTIFIKLVLFPLTYKSYKNQAKMRVLAPDIKAINDKYPGTENAMIRQQKTMALYNQAGANPMSGCLP
ncbi:MAG: YidC/Oxa1 family insertase periplasmic-domain containing protein, partial [Muribaculaceae bacterium]|nr:YidC/Oxa1 family insertase periplasmic-domain containing protein [Muribaculaceae bacterium]